MTARGARRWALAAGLPLLVLAGWVWPRSGERWGAVARGDWVRLAEASGQLESTEKEAVGPPLVEDLWEFKISFLAPEGKEVRAGEPVVGFDASDLERRLEEERTAAARAAEQLAKTRADRDLELANARLALAEAEARLGRAKLVMAVPAELKSANDLRTARLELEEAEREVAFRRAAAEQLGRRTTAELAALRGQRESAAAQVAQLEQAVASMQVKAPRAGTVIYASNWRGEKKKVGDPCWRGEPVIELPRLDLLRGVLEIAEADAGRVAVGQRVRLRLDSRAEREYTGRISRLHTAVAAVSRQDPRKVVRAEVALDEVDPAVMRPAMRFRATVEVERRSGVLLLPQSALERHGDRVVVERRRWFGVETVTPRLGAVSGDQVEVLSGLVAGDEVRLPSAGRGSPGP